MLLPYSKSGDLRGVTMVPTAAASGGSTPSVRQDAKLRDLPDQEPRPK